MVDLIGGTRAEVQRKRDLLGIADRAVLPEGHFAETFRQPKPEKACLIHLEGDLDDSTVESLDAFYPLVVEGGVIVLDDFGSLEGVAKAFYDWCRRNKVRPIVMTPDRFQLVWIQGMGHNVDADRDFPADLSVPPPPLPNP